MGYMGVAYKKLIFGLKIQCFLAPRPYYWDVNQIFCYHHDGTDIDEMPNLTLETRSKFFSLQSQASRRERDFVSLNLRVRDEIANSVTLI